MPNELIIFKSKSIEKFLMSFFISFFFVQATLFQKKRDLNLRKTEKNFLHKFK